MCVLHTHTVAGVAVSCQKQGQLPLNQWSLQFTDRLAYHDYEGIALDLDERARLVADLGDKFVIILRNDAWRSALRPSRKLSLQRPMRSQPAALPNRSRTRLLGHDQIKLNRVMIWSPLS
jgi:hypothetical protein